MSKETNQPTFLIYDYETFGKHPALDRPAQFASIRTNLYFEPLSNPEVFFCQPANDYLPSPEAVLITGITPQYALLKGMIESDFAKRIHQLFIVPNTCILGYNSIQFDDEVSRNLFYRNFYDPYSWSWINKNSRWDLIDVMRAFYALRPNGINWPLNKNGLPSFKLEHITKANNIKHDNKHNAIEDVFATMSIARLIQKTQIKLFDYLYKYRSKQKLKTLINTFSINPLVYVSSTIGADRSNITYIAPLAWHPNNPNALIVCDLSQDIQILQNLDIDEISKRFYTRQDEFGDKLQIPLKLVYINKCPILVPTNVLRHSDIMRIGMNYKKCLNNLEWLRNNEKICKKIVKIFINAKAFIKSGNVDAQLYDGFFNNSDRLAMNTILDTKPEDLSVLSLRFSDKRIKELLFRYRARNFPQTLNEKDRHLWLEYRKKIFNKERLGLYIKQLEYLHKYYINDIQKLNLIQSLNCYLSKLLIKLL